MACNTLNELLDVEYGVKGTSEREQFDHESRVFCLAETLKEERRRVGLTQEQLAEKICSADQLHVAFGHIRGAWAPCQSDNFIRLATDNYKQILGLSHR